MPEPSRNMVASYLRQMAPTQTHENRPEFIKAAELLEGINLRPKQGVVDYEQHQVLLAIPVNWGPQMLGYLSIIVAAGPTEPTELIVEWINAETDERTWWRPENISPTQTLPWLRMWEKAQETLYKKAIKRRNDALQEIIKFHDDYAEASGKPRYTIPQAVNKARALLTEDF